MNACVQQTYLTQALRTPPGPVYSRLTFHVLCHALSTLAPRIPPTATYPSSTHSAGRGRAARPPSSFMSFSSAVYPHCHYYYHPPLRHPSHRGHMNAMALRAQAGSVERRAVGRANRPGSGQASSDGRRQKVGCWMAKRWNAGLG